MPQTKTNGITLNNQFDELTKQMAQLVTRRGALKKFGLGLVGMALACFGLMNKSQAGVPHYCQNNNECAAKYGEVAVCCKVLGFKGCALSKSECQHGKIIWV